MEMVKIGFPGCFRKIISARMLYILLYLILFVPYSLYTFFSYMFTFLLRGFSVPRTYLIFILFLSPSFLLPFSAFPSSPFFFPSLPSFSFISPCVIFFRYGWTLSLSIVMLDTIYVGAGP